MGQGQVDRNGEKVLVALGSNATSHAGGPRATVNAAVAALRDLFGSVVVSKLYQTPAFPSKSGPDFINAACVFQSELHPRDVLLALHGIEAAFGRERVQRWGQRTLDLDLIAHGQTIAPDLPTHTHWATLTLEMQKTTAPDTLILPHPRLQDRAFVLVPLADVASDWVHPTLGNSIEQMVADLPDTARAEIEAV